MSALNEKGRRANLALALGVNAAFLALMLLCFAPMWETNDDLLMSKFVDGQLSRKTAYVPFINICLGWTLKTLYTLLGDGFNWYSAAQYLLLCLGFTALTWVLLERFRRFPALVMTAVLLGAFGTDCYLSMNFSKPAAVATVGGMSLLLTAMEREGKERARLNLLGVALGLCGYVWRFEEFGVCALLLACVFFSQSRGKTLRARGRELAPFVLLAALAVGLFAVNHLAWHRPEIDAYKTFDDTRSILIDFEIPAYAEMPEVYDRLKIDENFVYLMKNWSFYDTERFTLPAMETLIEARASLLPHRTLGEVLGVFLNECLPGYPLDRPFAGFAFLLALWLACGRRRGRDWLGLALMGGIFLAFTFFMIYNERYLVNRIDIGLFLAMALALSFTLDPEKLDRERLTLLAVLCLSLFVTWRANRPYCRFDSHNVIEDKSAEKAAVQRVLADTEHLYFVKVWAIDHNLYSPLETPPRGYADRLVHIGGWSMHHPVIEALLADWDIQNPWRDLLDREDVCLIDHDIDRSLAYLRRFYAPNAAAELIQPISSETGYQIYRLTSS